jgi:hypothetical protein
MAGRPEATANRLKSCGASRFPTSGVALLTGTNGPTGALTMSGLMFESEKVPLMPVISKALEYFASVAEPKVTTSEPLTPGPLKWIGTLAASARLTNATPASAAMTQCVFFILMFPFDSAHSGARMRNIPSTSSRCRSGGE